MRARKGCRGRRPRRPGGVKTPPYDAKDKGDTMARLRAGHARPLRGGVNELRAKARPTECGKVGRPAPRPPRTFAVMRSPADCCRGGGVPDAPGGVKTPPYDAKDKGDTMASLRAGHARPLRTTVNGSRTKGARGWLPLPFSPTKTKKTRRPLPRLVFS